MATVSVKRSIVTDYSKINIFAQMKSYSVHYDVIYYPFTVVCEGLTAPQYATNTDGLT